MRDRDTVIRSPHDATVTRKGGHKRVQIHDPRVSVSMQEQGATLTLFFDPADAHSGESALLEIRLTPPSSGKFEPWHLMPHLSLYAQYARASLAWKQDNAAAAIRALRKAGATRRGLGDEHYRIVAEQYAALVGEGERYPVKTLAAAHHVDKSTASRWVAEARRRGLLEPKEGAR